MIPSSCPVCGGKLNLKIGADFAVCEACGNLTECDPADTAQVRAVYRSAERSMHMNTVSGYREAIARLASIPFVGEAEELSTECERRLDALRAEQAKRQEREQVSDKKNTRLGVILLIVVLLLCAAAAVGAVYIAVRLVSGGLSPASLAIVAAVVVLAVAAFTVNKLK